MKVILLEELKGRGGEGDVVDVATGYAVNYLFPKKIALQATKGNLKQLELRKHNIAKRESERLDTADKMLAAIDGQKILIGAKVGEEGQLFGSVTPQRIADAINERFKTDFDRKRIDLQGAIKKAGEHTAFVSIYRDTKATVVIEVVDEKKFAELEKAEAGITDSPGEAEAEAVLEVETEAVLEVETEAEGETTDSPAEAEIEAETEFETEAEITAIADEDVEAEAEAEAEGEAVIEALEAEA